MSNAIFKLLGLNEEVCGLKADLEEALFQMEKELSAVCDCKNELLRKSLTRVIKSGGKRLRPVLVYLGYRIGKEAEGRADTDYPVVPMMTAAELVHTASLIHDDIIDMASVRRNVATINAQEGNFAAVQAGDYLLACAVRLAGHYKGLKADRHFSLTAKEMCVAEFMQMESEFRLDESSLENYFEQIKRKTAAFIASATALGAKAGGAPDEVAAKLEAFGTNAGIAFQIRDDVLDFVSDASFGKKSGQDLERGIFTLPLIFALMPEGGGSDKEREEAKEIALSEQKTEAQLQKLLHFVRESDAVALAQKEIETYTEKAVEALTGIKDSSAKEGLLHLADALAVRCI